MYGVHSAWSKKDLCILTHGFTSSIETNTEERLGIWSTPTCFPTLVLAVSDSPSLRDNTLCMLTCTLCNVPPTKYHVWNPDLKVEGVTQSCQSEAWLGVYYYHWMMWLLHYNPMCLIFIETVLNVFSETHFQKVMHHKLVVITDSS